MRGREGEREKERRKEKRISAQVDD